MNTATGMGDPNADNPEAYKILYYPALDWLRFTLAAIVVLYHESVPLPAPIDGGLAVQVFLALSGWLIGGILLRTSVPEMPRFFYNRTTRIWPPYLFTAALLYGLAAVKGGIDHNWFKYLLYDLTFTHYTFTVFPAAVTEMPLGGTGNHFWSISVEEQFYLVAPLIILFAAYGRRLLAWIVISVALLSFQSIFASIALGVTAAIINRDYSAVLLISRNRIVAIIVAAALLLALRAWNITPLRELFSVSIVVALTIPGRRSAVGGMLGAISYPLYLNHWLGGFIIQAVDKKIVHLSTPVAQGLSFFSSIAVAYSAWYVIDRQILSRRGGWYTNARGRACTIATYTLVSAGLIGGSLIMFVAV